MAELAGRTIEQIQALGGTDPQVSGLILEHGADIVGAERCLADRVVTEALLYASVALHSIQTAVQSTHPERSILVLQHTGYLVAAQRVQVGRRVAEVSEGAIGLSSIQ